MTNTAKRSYEPESGTVFSMTQPSSVTFGSSTPDMQVSMLERWIGCLPDSLANPSVLPAVNLARPMNETSGQQRERLLARFNLVTPSWRTYLPLFPADISQPYSLILLKSGTIVNGMLYQRLTLGHHISGNDSGYWRSPDTGQGGTSGLLKKGLSKRPDGQSVQIRLVDQVNNPRLWPTPASRDYRSANAKPYSERGGGKKGEQLPNAVAHYPTPTATDAIKRGNVSPRPGAMGLSETARGQLNPTWVEWLMGWPIGWTDLKPLEMDGFRRYLKEFCK